MQKKEKDEPRKYKVIDPVLPDRELLLWEEWICIRKEETRKLGERTGRPPVDLTMNLLEKVREDKEDKTILEHAQIEKKPTVRGMLWEQPQRLHQKCYCEPVYELLRTAAEMGRPQVVEHIGVPQYIQVKEKGLRGVAERKRFNQLDSDYNNYKIERENELIERIKKIDPYKPELSCLMIKGNRPKTPPKKMPPLPMITVNSAIDEIERALFSVYALRINNTVFYKDIPGQTLIHLKKMCKEKWHESCTSWTYYFNVPEKRAGRAKLFIENLGTTTLRYCWKKIKRTIPFIPEDVYEQVFYFNKNEDVLPPGQSKEIYFTFVSDKPGIFSEFWEFSLCNICFFDTLSDKLVINLYGDSVRNVDSIKRKINKMKSKINIKSIYNMVNEIVEDIFTKSTAVWPEMYPYKKFFLEAELFVMKNPVCFYHQSEVVKMKDLYKEMAPGNEWDLSISSWREMMMEKLFDDRMKYFDLLKTSHSDLLKPWYEGDDLFNQKYNAVMLLLEILAKKFDQEYMRITEMYGIDDQCSGDNINYEAQSRSHQKVHDQKILISLTSTTVQNVFYLHMYEHVATTIELISGVLSSLDLNRWIQFDFCRY